MIIGVGLYLVFLDSTESDVLLNFSSGSLEEVVGGLAADIITYCVLLGYALNLIFTYPMINWGLREVGFIGRSSSACRMLHVSWKCPKLVQSNKGSCLQPVDSWYAGDC